jgi:hypothetical protein
MEGEIETISESHNCPNRERWFHSTLGREDSDKLLVQYQPGSYLIRKSDKTDDFRLSVVGNDEVKLIYTFFDS